MRLDKFLKVSRIIKRRSVANTACSGGHIQVNGKIAKPGTALKIGDEITITFNENISKYKVLDLKEHTLKDDSSSLYEVIS